MAAWERLYGVEEDLVAVVELVDGDVQRRVREVLDDVRLTIREITAELVSVG